MPNGASTVVMRWLRGAADNDTDDHDLHRELAETQANEWLLSERIAELERLNQATDGWAALDGGGDLEFSRGELRRIVRQSRIMYLRNPVIQHAVDVQAHYVFGQGIAVQAEHPTVDAVVQSFWDDDGNRAALTSQEALLQLEVELAATGNLFFALFPDHGTGDVKARHVAVEEIEEIITNPADRSEVWFYKRRIPGAQLASSAEYAMYPDLHYVTSLRARPTALNGHAIRWGTPIMHVKVGGFPSMRFGLPETYAALDWATALKQFHEDGATVRRAQSRFAARATTKGGGATGVAAARAKLATTRTAGSVETNPAPTTGSTFIGNEMVDYQLMKMSGNAPDPDEGRGLVLMVAAGVGIPETILMGNADVGNLATSKTLDRPTELKMAARQALWKSIIGELLTYVIDWAVRAPQGALAGLAKATVDGASGRWTITFGPDKDAEVAPGDERPAVNRHVNVDFPDLLERDIKARVDAVVAAAPFLGEHAGDLLARLLLTALGEDDLDEILDVLFPDEEQDDDDTPAPAVDADPLPALEAELMRLTRQMQEAMAS